MKKQSKNVLRIFPWILGIVTAVILFAETEVCNYNTKLLQMEWKNIAMNVAILFAVLLAVYLIFDRWWIAIGSTGILFSVLCVINVYSMQFRSTPISARDLYNARSAANVLSSYSITWNKRVGLALGVGVALCMLAALCFWIERNRKHTWRHWGRQLLGGTVAIVAFFWCLCYGTHAVKPANISTLRYEEGYQVYGFMQVSVEVFQKAAYKISKPDGYHVNTVEALASRIPKENRRVKEQLPDIVLILNESWYDLTQVSTLTIDVEVMPYINHMENTLRGYVVEPNISSGTNLSEYEALTGNSLQLMQGITPFNSLNMEGASSIVSCLNEQGYETAAFHSETRSTYNRIVAYPAMGFQQYYFIDDFEEWDYWEQRTECVTDESNFNNLMRIYDGMTADIPRFVYDLTTQNHGDYLLNNYQKSTVHVNEQLEDEWLAYRVNEYLSCVNLTDEAFWKLTKELEAQERPVLVCMLGDHAPAFVENVADQELSQEEMDMRLRSTPYVIWANFDLSDWKLPEYMGLPYIPSVLLKLTGAELTPYYDYMVNELMPRVPVLTAYNHYCDAGGIFYRYEDETPYSELLNQYFYMEYNTVKGGTESVDTLFHLK